ncbi:MAG: glycosyltransferase [Acidobacteriaceae bacterium]|nr:glycosyltransferase [Acidobacteriaceae bacterium]
MTILNVAYPLMPVSECSGGGAEQILYILQRGLVKAGHRSIVIAAGGSLVDSHLVQATRPSSEITDEVRCSAQQAHQDAIYIALQRYPVDLIHFHGLDFYEYLPRVRVPMLATLHLPVDWYPRSIFELPQVVLNLVSRSQAASHSAAACLPVVCNGVELWRYSPSEDGGDFLLMLARICPEKGVDVGLRIAYRLGLPLILAGPIHPYEAHRRYFAERVQPLLDDRRCYIGPVGARTRTALLARAKCLLVPSLVQETSSLAAMEAICSGTPVIGFRSGALPEVIDQGSSGFIVDSEEEMAEAVGRVGEISAKRCRAIGESRFDSRRMVREYLAIYDRLVREDGHRMLRMRTVVPLIQRSGGELTTNCSELQASARRISAAECSSSTCRASR